MNTRNATLTWVVLLSLGAAACQTGPPRVLTSSRQPPATTPEQPEGAAGMAESEERQVSSSRTGFDSEYSPTARGHFQRMEQALGELKIIPSKPPAPDNE